MGMFISSKTEENTHYTKINFREIKDLNVKKKKKEKKPKKFRGKFGT